MSEKQKFGKTKLPTKIKIACWYMVGYAIVETVVTIWFLFHFPGWSDEAEWSMGAVPASSILVITGFLYCLPSIIITFGTRSAWTVAIPIMIANILILILTAFTFISSYFYIGSENSDRIILLIPVWIAGVVPLILVIIDRKNYFEMLRQRELEKK